MPVLDNSKHELFAQALAKGATADAAYVEAGYKANRGNAARLNANESVLSRVQELKAEAAKGVVYDLEALIKDLEAIIHGKPCEVSEEHPLAELKMSKAGEYYAFPSKATAMDMLAKLRGWYKPEKKEVAVTGVDDLIKTITHE